MRALAFGMAFLLSACGAGAAHPYSDAAKTAFHRSCPESDPVCTCTWGKITRALTQEEYDAALSRFRSEGLMDPRVTHARTVCVETHGR